MPAALREIRRVLKPGGAATVIVYNRNSLHYWVHQFLTRGVLLGGLLRERRMAGVLSSSVEYSSIGARPLVRVYGRRQLAAMLRDAGFERVEVRVRHFAPTTRCRPGSSPGSPRRVVDQRRLDRVGRVAGWYLVGRGYGAGHPAG